MKFRFIGILLYISVSLFSFQKIYSPIHKYEKVILNNLQVQLDNKNIIISSEKVILDSIQLEVTRDYVINYKEGRLNLLQEGEVLEIIYQILPKEFAKPHFIFVEQSFQDSIIEKNRIKVHKRSYADSDISISGNKTISLSLASRDNLDFDQSLFLQINGDVSKTVKIEAQLSDSQTPFSPEGDSKLLSSLEQVFVKIYSKKFDISFGDLTYKMLNSELMNFQYNFEGVKAAYHTNQKAKGALAFTQGKHNSTIIEGIEGKQGPYFIELASDNSGVKIIAGTESVFLDGILMNRGDDYRIEYDEGTITFYQKQIINSESIILVKFEYSDENFRKNVYLTSSQFDIPFGFDVWHNMMIQIDDKENPLADSFSEAELDTLQTYGDQEIWVSGITENEEGNYSLVDGNPSYYIYDDDGNYSITFSYVGQGNGNYQRLSFAEFEYVGEEIGSWIPQRKLIPAQEIANYNFGFSFSKHDIILDNEVVVSNYDENSYSSRDDNDNFGYVTHSSLKWKPDFDNILPKIAVGYRNFSKNLKQISSIENPTDSFNQSEFTKVDSVKRQEFSLNSSIDLYKKFALINNGKIEQYAGIGNRTSFDNRIRMQQFNWIPQSEFRFYSLDEDNFLEDFQKFTKNYSLLLNLKKKYWSTSNAITNTNFDSNQVNPTSEKKTFNITNSIQSEDLEKYSASISSRITKKEDRLNSDYQAITMQYRQLVQLENHIFNINYSRRKIDYNDNSIENDQKFDFLELVTSNKFMGRAFSIKNNYSIDNIEFYPKEKQLIFVGESVGLFDSTGVYSEEGEYDWDYVNIGEPELVTETKINTRISMQPSYIKILKDNDFFRRIKGDLYFIQSEKSYYKNKLRLYLFFPEATFNSDSSIFSRMNIRQTIWFDFIPKKFVTKYTFEHDKSFDNRYVTTYQRNMYSHNILNRLTGYYQSIFELLISKQKEDESKYDSVVNSTFLELSIKKQVSKRLVSNVSFSLSNELGQQNLNNLEYKLNSYNVSSNLSYFPNNRSKVDSKIGYNKNYQSGDDFFNFISSKRDGSFWDWGVVVNYQYNSFTSINISYEGEIVPDETVEHSLKVEIVAEF